MRLEKEVETRGMDVPEAFQETSLNETVADVSQLQLDNSFYHRLAILFCFPYSLSFTSWREHDRTTTGTT